MLLVDHQGELAGSGPGWWSVHFADVDSATAFVKGFRELDASLSAVIHQGPPDVVSEALVARLAASAPVGAIWLTPSALGDRELPLHEVRSTRSVEVVATLEAGGGRRLRWAAPAGRDEDAASIDALFALGLRTVVVTGNAGVGKSRLLRELAVRGDGLYLDVHHVHDGWSLLYAIGARVGVPVNEQGSLERAVAQVVAGIDAVSAGLVVLDHVDTCLVDLLCDVLSQSRVRWLVGGIDRIGVRGEVGYRIGPIPHEPTENGMGPMFAALSEVVRGHPLAARVLAIRVIEPVEALHWLDRISAAGSSSEAVASALHDLLSEDALTVLRALVDLPRSFPVRGLQRVTKLEPERWDIVWSELVRTGLVELRRGATGASRAWVSSWVADLEVEDEPREAVLRAWADWAVERVTPWIQGSGDRSGRVLEVLDAEFELYDAIIGGLLRVQRVGAEDLARLASLLRARAWHAVQLGPALPLTETLGSALTAVGRSFDVGPEVAIELLHTRGMVLSHLERWDAALADLERADGLAVRRDLRPQLDRIQLLVGTTHLLRGRFDEAESALNRVRDTPVAGALARSALGGVYMAQGRLQEAHQVLERCATDFEALELQERAVFEGRRALVYRRLEERGTSVGHYERALSLWKQLGRPQRELFTNFRLATLLQSMGQLERAEAHYARAATLSRRSGDDARLALIKVQQGLIALERDDLEAAAQAFNEAQSSARAGSDRGAEGAATGFKALVWLFVGDIERARVGFREALRNLETGEERRFGALFHSCLSAAEVEMGNLEEARILLDIAALQLPDADQGMRSALALFDGIIDAAAAGQARKNDEPERAEELVRRVRKLLDAAPVEQENVYQRFVRRYLQNKLEV